MKCKYFHLYYYFLLYSESISGSRNKSRWLYGQYHSNKAFLFFGYCCLHNWESQWSDQSTHRGKKDGSIGWANTEYVYTFFCCFLIEWSGAVVISLCLRFYSLVCYLLLKVRIGICKVRNSLLKKKVLHATDVIDSSSLCFSLYVLQNIEDIFEPSSHFSLLLSV